MESCGMMMVYDRELGCRAQEFGWGGTHQADYLHRGESMG